MDNHGEPVGFAWPGDGQVDVVVHPDHRQLDDEMLSCAEGERRRQAGAGSALRARASKSDLRRQETLLKRGHTPTDEVL